MVALRRQRFARGPFSKSFIWFPSLAERGAGHDW
jgi:hypothetical protein